MAARSMLRHLSAFVLTLSLTAPLAARAEVRGSGWVEPAPAASAPAEVRATVEEADALYRTREQGRNAELVADKLREAVKAHPGSWDLEWRLARALFWLAESTADKEKRRALGWEGWEAGQRAVKTNPKGVEGLYFGAICIGDYSTTVGVLTALSQGLEAKVRDPLLEAEKIDPRVDHAGLYNALGRYKYSLPWPKRDLDGSVAYLRRGLEVNPQSLRTRLFLAESLLARGKDADREEARRLVNEVLEAPVGRYDKAEEIRAQGLARALAKTQGWSAP